MLSVGLTSVAICATLSGCTGVSRVAVFEDGNTIKFAYCEPYVANQLTVWAGPLTKPRSNIAVVWKVSGSGSFGPAKEVSYGVVPDGFYEVQAATPIVAKQSRLSFEFLNTRESGQGSVEGVFDGNNLVDGKWVRWDGSVSDSACPG
jgi:hypothetical protein